MLYFMRYERRLLRPNGNVSGAGNDRRRYMEVNGFGGTASGPVGENFYRGVLSGNALKIIACVSMLVDHIGMILFPDVVALRIVGRLAMPLFAFTFAEGCYYSHKRSARFALILILGVFYAFSENYFAIRHYIIVCSRSICYTKIIIE